MEPIHNVWRGLVFALLIFIAQQLMTMNGNLSALRQGEGRPDLTQVEQKLDQLHDDLDTQSDFLSNLDR